MTGIRAAILGASGYTGAELVRLLARHPDVAIAALTADRKAGQGMGEVFPHLAGLDLPPLTAIDEVAWAGIDVVFGCLPHGTMQDLVRELPAATRIIDLSADFRLRDPEIYAEWYGRVHSAVDLQPEAVYGIPEIYREDIARARIVAGPGCYPTAAQVPLVPLLASGLISTEDIVIDAKSGVTGAGRGLRESSLHAELSEGFQAYGVAGHRHGPEIEQGLSEAAGKPVVVNFTPHLLPMNRGILETIYVKLAGTATPDALRAHLQNHYSNEPFVRMVPEGVSPATRHVRGSNQLLIGVFPDRLPGRAIVISVIDNLVKGASGQLVQCMNAMFGLPEDRGLEQLPLFP